MSRIDRREVMKWMACFLAAGSTSSAIALEEPNRILQTGPANEQSPFHTSSWLRSAVFYQVYPQSFYDSDGDGTGDLIGLISKLDYIQSIGCNSIWLNPVFDSPFGDAGYDVADFLKVAPRYGINDDIRELTKEAHRRGMRIFLDLVAGHTSVQHPWFRESMKREHNKYSDWYIWMPADTATDKSYAAPGSPNDRNRPEHYLPNFFSFQPALNYGYHKPDPSKPWQRSVNDPVCRAVQDNLRQVMKFWLDMGVDGFRVDMASSLIRNDPDGTGIREFWQTTKKWLHNTYPEAILISEWGHPVASIPAGFDIDFLLHFGQPAYIDLVGPRNRPDGDRRTPDAFFERAGAGDITKFVSNYQANYSPTRGIGYISLPTGNHDFPRPTWGRDERDVRVLFAMLLTMPGVPFLYYGDEIGMRFLEQTPEKEGANNAGLRAGSRTPMQWTAGKNAGFSNAPEGDLYLPIDPNPSRPNVAAQEKDSDSMLNFTRRLLQLRRDTPALSNDGDFKVLFAEPEKVPFVYERREGLQRVIVAINPSHQSVDQPLIHAEKNEILLAVDATLLQGTLRMKPLSFGLFLVKD